LNSSPEGGTSFSIFDLMAACDPISFSGITPEVFQKISRQLADKGFALSGPKGTVNGPFGIVIDYEWNEQTGEVRLEVLEKSFFVPCSQIKDQLTQAFQKYG
jgi:hypothetical protein